ncbi:hypothetical protein AA16663_1463 [Komagataeibacter rhaeticus DSM 16663]|nr:hypothetical protein AA16663_1463 [Komagataeibacter rhaeticus DSM 16663]
MGAAKLEPAPVISAACAMTGRAVANRAHVSIRAGKYIILMFSDMKIQTRLAVKPTGQTIKK